MIFSLRCQIQGLLHYTNSLGEVDTAGVKKDILEKEEEENEEEEEEVDEVRIAAAVEDDEAEDDLADDERDINGSSGSQSNLYL